MRRLGTVTRGGTLRKTITVRTVAAATAAVVAVGMQVLAASSASAATDIRVGLNPTINNGIGQYAQDAGYFARNGLNATLVVSPAPPQTISQLQAGQIDFAYIPIASALPAYTNGGIAMKIIAPSDGISRSDAVRAQKSKAYAAAIDAGGVCVRPDSGINRPKDLEGKTVGVTSRGGLAELGYFESVRRDGGDPKKLTYAVIGFPESVAAVKNGRVAAAFTGSGYTPQCKAEGMKVLMQPSLAIQPNGGPRNVWVTTADYYAKNPATVKAFQKSIYEVNTATHKKANMREMIIASTKLTKQPLELALSQRPNYHFTALTKSDIQEVANALQRAGMVVKPVDVPGVLAPQYRP